MKRYLELCEPCFADLYRMAILATGNKARAEALVRETCVEGVKVCARLRTVREVKLALTGMLFRRCAGETDLCGASVLPEAFRGMDAQTRLLLAARFCAGLRFAEVCAALEMEEAELHEKIGEILRKWNLLDCRNEKFTSDEKPIRPFVCAMQP